MDKYSKATTEGIAQAEKAKAKKGTYKKINTPFGYFGSKNKIAAKLCKELPPHNCWVEAFGGSAALTLRKKPSPIEIINDINNDIVNVFRQLRDNKEELRQLILFTPYSRQELADAREFNPEDSDLEKARKFLIQAMMAINGIFGKERGGFSYSTSYSRNGREARVNRWVNLPERLDKVVERIKNVRIDNRDARDLIRIFSDRPATLMYLDPPYLANRTNGYTHDQNDIGFHSDLLTLAKRSKCMIFISGYENDLYNKILSDKNGWQKRSIDTNTKGSNGEYHGRTEVLWTNKHYQSALKTGELPIILTKTELKDKKLNPSRKRS